MPQPHRTLYWLSVLLGVATKAMPHTQKPLSIQSDMEPVTFDLGQCEPSYVDLLQKFHIASNVNNLACNTTTPQLFFFGERHDEPHSKQVIGEAINVFCNSPETSILTEGETYGRIYDCNSLELQYHIQESTSICSSWEDPLAYRRTQEYFYTRFLDPLLEDVSLFLLDLKRNVQRESYVYPRDFDIEAHKERESILSGPMGPFPYLPYEYIEQYRNAAANYLDTYVNGYSTRTERIEAARQIFAVKKLTLIEEIKQAPSHVEKILEQYLAAINKAIESLEDSPLGNSYHPWERKKYAEWESRIGEAKLGYSEYGIKIRNRGMEKAIRKSIIDGKKICVIAGEGHFSDNPAAFYKAPKLFSTMKHEDIPQQELADYADNFSYALMIAKPGG